MKLHMAAVLAWLKSKKENNGNKRIAVGSKNNSPSGDGGNILPRNYLNCSTDASIGNCIAHRF